MATTELRNTVLLRPQEPDPTNPLRVPGELWVDSEHLTMYVFSPDIGGGVDGAANPAWVGVTSGQNNGSIIYSSDTAPTLNDVYPNLPENDFPLDPLPGTVWYDTTNNMLKIYYVTPNGDSEDTNSDAYTGYWISVTTSHYLTEATASLINELQLQVNSLTDTVANLETIING